MNKPSRTTLRAIYRRGVSAILARYYGIGNGTHTLAMQGINKMTTEEIGALDTILLTMETTKKKEG